MEQLKKLSRRGFLAGLGAAFLAAPAIVSAAVPWRNRLAAPRLVGDGVADDTDALQALLDDLPDGGVLHLEGAYRITRGLRLSGAHKTFSGARLYVGDARTCVFSGSGKDWTISRIHLDTRGSALEPDPWLSLISSACAVVEI